jgi:hypothetical protein
MLKTQGIWDTVKQGMQEGLFVLRSWRPDRSFRTWWRETIRDEDLSDSSMEIVLLEAAELEHLPADLLVPDRLPGLWPKDGGLTMAMVTKYFCGTTTVEVTRNGYAEPAVVPYVAEKVLIDTVKMAVADRVVWVVNGPVSLWGESVPDGVITGMAQLNTPPEPIGVFDVLADNLPEAWENGSTTALAISIALSNRRSQPLPWSIVRQAITDARNAGLITLETADVTWPCALSEAGSVRIQISQTIVTPTPPAQPTMGDKKIRSERQLKPAEVQNFAEVIGKLVQDLQAWSPAIHVAIELDTTTMDIDSATRERVDALLKTVDGNWHI